MFRPKIRFTHDEIRVLVFALNELRNTLIAEETAIALDEEAMKEMDYFQHSPEEQLSMDIASHLADNAARRVGEILGDVDYDIRTAMTI